jgi:hypothetical protein
LNSDIPQNPKDRYVFTCVICGQGKKKEEDSDKLHEVSPESS